MLTEKSFEAAMRVEKAREESDEETDSNETVSDEENYEEIDEVEQVG